MLISRRPLLQQLRDDGRWPLARRSALQYSTATNTADRYIPLTAVEAGTQLQPEINMRKKALDLLLKNSRQAIEQRPSDSIDVTDLERFEIPVVQRRSRTCSRSALMQCASWVLLAGATVFTCEPLLAQQSAPAERPDTVAESPESRANMLANKLGGQLKGELLQAIEADGLTAAISVCADRAPAIAEQISIDNHVRLGRTTTRWRNPDNAPNDWQREWLAEFADRKNNGEPLQDMMKSQTNIDVGEFRYMKAIGTEPLCLACHGENISSPVHAAIRARYPEDTATGYKLGELRGAFVVTWPLETTLPGSPKN